MPNLFQSVGNVIKTAVTHPIKSFFAAGQPAAKALQNFANKNPQQAKDTITNLAFGALPVGGLAKGASTAGSVASKAWSGAKTIFNRTVKNPLEGVALKTGLTNVGKKILGWGMHGALLGTSYSITKSMATGENISPSTIAKGTVYGLSAGMSLPGAIAGEISGNIQNISNKMAGGSKNFWDIINNAKGGNSPYMSTPNIKNQITPFIDYGRDIIGDMRNGFNYAPPSVTYNQAPVNVMMQSPQIPQSGGVSFSPSISAGGGGELLPMLLLLAGGAGVGGYMLGKRKKKKYKKRRKH